METFHPVELLVNPSVPYGSRHMGIAGVIRGLMVTGLQSSTDQEGCSLASDPSGNNLPPAGSVFSTTQGEEVVAGPESGECPPALGEPSAMTVSILSPHYSSSPGTW